MSFGLIMVFLGCSTAREDVVLEAVTYPFLDWYSLKLYSNGEFDLHIPSIDYSGIYTVADDTVFLKSIETEQQWTFLIDREESKITTIKNAGSPAIRIDVISNKLPKYHRQ